MYLAILSKHIDVLGSSLTQRETVTLESLDNLEENLSWYKDHSYKFEMLYEVKHVPMDVYNKVCQTYRKLK